MPMVCGHCQRTLEYSGDPPKFCAYCGVRLDFTAADTIPDPAGPARAGATVAYDGAPDTSPDDGPPPDAVGGYRLLRRLGAGGMGTVYEAESAATGQHVAVKVLAAKFASHAVSLERFRLEGQLASLIAHPRCVFVLAADEEAGRPYIVMELMPGDTLRDLVTRRGPLPPVEAVVKIVDVIEGLREAHRLGILHRDVKPSNCFLMPDGRVKVGDFGLAKSLAGDVQLTQTGAFLGTVLFASPEQVRGEGVDYVSDVYSVCATLYFLLTGRAPFQHSNAGTVLAKVVSEDPPLIRPQRPDVSRRLERVVLKGLERDKGRRWQTLDELHAALTAFVPSTTTRGSLGLRFAALLIDTILLFVLAALAEVSLRLGLDQVPGVRSWIDNFFGWASEFAYYALADGLWGCSVGKWCLRLRVCPTYGSEPPPWPRVVVRTAIFVGCLNLPALVDLALAVPEMATGLLWVGAVVALMAPMRRRNGYRGLHELASGTRVIQLPWTVRPRPFRPLRERYPAQPLPAGRYPREFGPFRVSGLLHADDRATVLLADDPGLGRTVHLWLRASGSEPLSPARLALARPSRPRWLGGGTSDGWTWDAYFAPQGGPLADLVDPGAGLGWTEGRFILEQLADELAEARADGTLPSELGLDQVWVLPDGRVQLLDFDLDGRHGFPPDDAGALALLREVAELAVEGERRPPDAPPAPIHAPVPRHAVELLDRLMGARAAFASLAEFRAALAETHARPTETTRLIRTTHVGVQAIFLAAGLAWMLAFSGLYNVWEANRIGDHIRDAEATVQALDDPNRRPDALQEIHSIAPSLPDLPNDAPTLRQRIGRQLDRDRAERDRNIAAMNGPERLVYRVVFPDDASEPQNSRPGEVRNTLKRAAQGTDAPGERRWSDSAGAAVIIVAFVPAAWVIWAFVTRGGLALSLMGLALVRRDGRKAGRWQCGWRALLVWVPVVIPLTACLWVKMEAPQFRYLHTGLWWLAVAVLLAELFVAPLRPQRALHDRLAGTYVVPL
jgi:hypothetical protein